MSLLESDEVARRRPSPLSDAVCAPAHTPTAERKPLTGRTFSLYFFLTQEYGNTRIFF